MLALETEDTVSEMMKEVLLMVGSETEETVSEMMKEKPTRDMKQEPSPFVSSSSLKMFKPSILRDSMILSAHLFSFAHDGFFEASL